MATHRYLGIAVGLLVLAWFASGIVMLFVRWPEVSDEERAAALPPIPWERCCRFGETADVLEVSSAVVEDVAGRPVLRLDGRTLDLSTGRPLAPLTAEQARRVAASYARAAGLPPLPAAEVRRVDRDQWTVTGYFDDRRPFWRIAAGDARDTHIYVSAATGQVAQVTDRPTRILAWLGPIPHWLYPSILRQDTRTWTQVVIWTSILGLFLTTTGVYLGVVAWRPWRDERLTPFRGLMAWHHVTGLAAGLLTLTWTASGLFSMQPWGFLESGPDHGRERLAGAVSLGQVKAAIVAAKAEGVTTRQLQLAPLDGAVFLLADAARFDAAARPAPLSAGALAAAARRLGPVASATLIREGDAYYYSHHEEVRLPAYRVVLRDGVRYYLDPASARVLARVDAPARGYRWLHLGLHRLDFVPGLDRGAGWAAAMTLLLVFAGAGVATGVWLAWRRVRSDLDGLARARVRPSRTAG